MEIKNPIIHISGGPLTTVLAATTEVTIDGVTYTVYWPVEPTETNRVYGFSFDPVDGHAVRIFSDSMEYSLQEYVYENH